MSYGYSKGKITEDINMENEDDTSETEDNSENEQIIELETCESEENSFNAKEQ